VKTKSLSLVLASTLLLAACAPHHVKPTPTNPQIRQNAKNKPVPSLRTCTPSDPSCRTP